MTRSLSVAHLTALDLAPPRFIEAAARAGFDGVGLRLLRVSDTTPGYPLMDDPEMMRATLRATRATGVKVMDIEFVRITPETRPIDLARVLDAGAELGAGHVITAPYDPDLARLTDRLGEINALAVERGLGTVIEFFPWTVVPDLNSAVVIAEAAGPDVGILVDALHFYRSASTLAELRAVPPHRLPFAHLCDALVHPPYSEADLLHTARADRLPPGRGEMDLRGFLSALPADVRLSAEVPSTPTHRLADRDAMLADIRDCCESLLKGCSSSVS